MSSVTTARDHSSSSWAVVNPLPASPFEQPSAAGEQLMLEQAGLVAASDPEPAPSDDGGTLFALALIVFGASAAIVWLRRAELGRVVALRSMPREVRQ